MFCCCCGPTRRSASVSDLSGDRIPVAAQAIATAPPPDHTPAIPKPYMHDIYTRRRHFWETAAAYGGHPATWSALRDYCATHDTDKPLADAMLLSVGVSEPRIAPSGRMEAYDASGFRYEIPDYCFTLPVPSGPSWSVARPTRDSNDRKDTKDTKDTNDGPPTTVNMVLRFANNQYPDLHTTVSSQQQLGEVLPKVHAHVGEPWKEVLFFRCGQGPIPCDMAVGEVMTGTGCGVAGDGDTVVMQVMFR